ncbi:MAG TPA: FG-GAP-like repeat-containing protein, partial [candidate division Zixibacteria bacterium]
PSTEYTVGGNNPHLIFAADLDGDGDLDLATANYGSHNVSVLLNNGNATFSPSTEYPVGGNNPRSIFAADLDGDGDLDLATANEGGRTVSVLLNINIDIAVINIVPSKEIVVQGDSVSIDVTVQNQGSVRETFDVTTFYDDIPIQTKTVTELAPSQETTISFNWNTTGIVLGNYTISAYAPLLPGEIDTDDNTYRDGMVSIIYDCGDYSCGDCNGDCKITVSDVVYLINYLFKGGYVPVPEKCLGDANGDGKVTVSDVVYLINYLFKGGPAPAACCQ